MYYQNLEALKGKTLAKGDIVMFGVVKYGVESSFLENRFDTCNNGEIFKLLEIPDKYKFCEKYYGFLPSYGGFPETERGDYISLTKVAVALMELMEAKLESKKKK